ncbi:MAG: methionine synthase, partial [Chloroflexi bacterium]|nr:methionine synthase [Chloroflexota bacterium]
MQLIDLLLGDGPVIADGGMGSMLLAQGLAQGAAPEVWNIERPEVVIGVHRDYINAGAQIILTNSFGGNAQRLGLAGLSSRASDLNESAARLGRQAADDAAHPVVVAGSMGPLGVLLEPYGEIERPHAISLFTDQALSLIHI